MSGRRGVSYATVWDPDLLAWARAYAARHALTVRAVLTALAEYAARRDQTGASPAPQLHYRRGHPPASVLERQVGLLRVDPRGRKLRPVSTGKESRDRDVLRAAHSG